MKSTIVSQKIQMIDMKSNSIPLITFANLKKRKVYRYNDKSDHDENNNNNEPERKKRKFNLDIDNKSDMNNKLNVLVESNESLQKQNDALKQRKNELSKERNRYKNGVNVRKMEANKWRSQYVKLYSQLRGITNDIKMNINQCENNNNNISIAHINKSNNTTYDGIKDRLLEMGFDETEITNKISSYDGSDPQFIFNQLINTFTSDTGNTFRQLRSNSKGLNNNTDTSSDCDSSSSTDSDSDDDSSSADVSLNNNSDDYISFENSYDVSVNCHMCTKHFDSIYEYRDHIKQHYENDATKEWRQCDFGCGSNPKQDMHFIRHLSTHTNDRPYKCKVIVNGIKCKSSVGYKSHMKRHWENHFNIQHRQTATGTIKNIKIKNIKIKKEYKRRYQHKKNKIKLENIDHDITSDDFEDNYYVSVHCHVCKIHFDNFNAYRQHIKEHYDNDSNKKWRQCNFGCKINPKKPLFHCSTDFISHISQHTKDKPFKCGMIYDGQKCNGSAGTKANLKVHWQAHSRNNNNNNSNNKNYMLCNFNNNNATYADFEDSYYFSVDCHMCGKHFDNYDEYRQHIKQHYNHEANKKWLKCDFGCKITSQKPLFYNSADFISHISQHTNDKPYKCNVLIHGIKCNKSAGTKNNIKIHWRSHFQPNHRYSNSKSKSKSKKKSKNINCKTKSKRKIKIKKEKSVDLNEIDFENSYYVSINCHLCAKHFDELYLYRDHMEKHYNIDPTKQWKRCDLCKINKKHALVKDSIRFISHIFRHTNDKPFKCNVLRNGIKCRGACRTKGNMKSHWQKSHGKKIKKKIIKTSGMSMDLEFQNSCDDSSSSNSTSYSGSSETESETESESDNINSDQM